MAKKKAPPSPTAIIEIPYLDTISPTGSFRRVSVHLDHNQGHMLKAIGLALIARDARLKDGHKIGSGGGLPGTTLRWIMEQVEAAVMDDQVTK